jgi:hypothetical protein
MQVLTAKRCLWLSNRRFEQATIPDTLTATIDFNLALVRFQNIGDRQKQHVELLRQLPESTRVPRVDFGARISNFTVTVVPLHRRDPNGGTVSGQFDLGSRIQLQQIKDWAIDDHRPAIAVFHKIFDHKMTPV